MALSNSAHVKTYSVLLFSPFTKMIHFLKITKIIKTKKN